MAGNKAEYEKYYTMMIVAGSILLLVNLYYFAHPVFANMGLSSLIMRNILRKLAEGGFLRVPLTTKFFGLLLILMACVVRSGKGKKVAWGTVIAGEVLGLAMFFLYPWPGYDYDFSLYFACLSAFRGRYNDKFGESAQSEELCSCNAIYRQNG